MAALLCLAWTTSGTAQQAPSLEYIDATATYVPQDPTIRALEAAFVDVDHDGDKDVVVVSEYFPNRLYLNDSSGISPTHPTDWS